MSDFKKCLVDYIRILAVRLCIPRTLTDNILCSTLEWSLDVVYVIVGAISLSISCVMSIYVLSKRCGGNCMRTSHKSNMPFHGTVCANQSINHLHVISVENCSLCGSMTECR